MNKNNIKCNKSNAKGSKTGYEFALKLLVSWSRKIFQNGMGEGNPENPIPSNPQSLFKFSEIKDSRAWKYIFKQCLGLGFGKAKI